MKPRLEPMAWLLWLIAAGAIPLTSRHPLYLALILLVVVIVHLSVSSTGERARPWRLFAYVGSSVAVLSIGFNVLTVHVGDRPFAEIPGSLPIIGGKLTYNALVYGIASALAISSLLFAAATFNSAVSHVQFIRRIPKRFQRLGVSAAIAMNFVPQTIRAGQDIYDAQRARGRQMRNVGDARAFLVPLLGNGLERAVQMSEALETRGYGQMGLSPTDARADRWRVALAASFVVAALPFLATGRLLVSIVLASLAIAALGLRRPVGVVSRKTTAWTPNSRALAIASCSTLALVGYTMATSAALEYTPFPRLTWPDFDPLVGVAISLLLAPAILPTDSET